MSEYSKKQQEKVDQAMTLLEEAVAENIIEDLVYDLTDEKGDPGGNAIFSNEDGSGVFLHFNPTDRHGSYICLKTSWEELFRHSSKAKVIAAAKAIAEYAESRMAADTKQEG